MPPASATATTAKRRPRSMAARAQAATMPRAPVARSRVTNGSDLLPGIDARSITARRYRDICAALASDQGGADRMSEARAQLCRRFAAAAVMAESMEAALVNGAVIDIAQHALLASTLCRLASRIGINRTAREIVPTLRQYIEANHAEPA